MENKYFNEAIQNLTSDYAYGAQIKRLYEKCLSTSKIKEKLDYPVSYEKVYSYLSDYLLKSKKVVLSESDIPFLPQPTYTLQQDSYGRKSFCMSKSTSYVLPIYKDIIYDGSIPDIPDLLSCYASIDKPLMLQSCNILEAKQEEYLKELNSKGFTPSLEYVENVVALVKERCSFAKELWDNSDYFFVRPSEYAEKALKKRWKEGTSQRMNDIIDNLSKIEDNNEWGEKAETFLMDYIPKNELNMGQIMNSIRLAIVGDTKGVNMVEIFKLLGKQESLERIRIASEKINL